MKKMMGLLLVVFVLVAGNAYAHCGKCGVGDAPMDSQVAKDAHFDMMSKELGLDADQQVKVKAIMDEKMAKKQEIMDQKYAAMEALRADAKTKLQAVLSEEQMKKWETLKGVCPLCKDGKDCDACKAMKGEMKAHCPMCKEGKMCDACKAMKGEMKAHCHLCKKGKMCDACKAKKAGEKGVCPHCKEGKMCDACKMMKEKEAAEKGLADKAAEVTGVVDALVK